MSSPQQKVLYLLSKQGKFAVGQADIPAPGPGEITVKLEATALNPIDWKIQATGHYISEYPAILGVDGAGVVTAVGEGVQDRVVGDKVLFEGFLTNRFGTYQEYSVVPAEVAAKIPDNITYDQAASIPAGLTTAALALYGPKWENGGVALFAPWDDEKRDFYKNRPIVIFGGGSSVGSYMIQLAKLSGFSPIITTVSPHNFEHAKDLGATHPIDRKLIGADLIQAIRDITDKPIEIVADAVSSQDTQSTGYDVLANVGQMVVVQPPSVDASKRSADKELCFVFGNIHPTPHRKFGANLAAHLPALLKAEDIKPNKVQYFPGGLSAIPDLLERMKNGEFTAQKVVVRPPETL